MNRFRRVSQRFVKGSGTVFSRILAYLYLHLYLQRNYTFTSTGTSTGRRAAPCRSADENFPANVTVTALRPAPPATTGTTPDDRKAAHMITTATDPMPTADERRHIEAQIAIARQRVFTAAIPPTFRCASLTDLEPFDQHVIEDWLAGTSRTLVITGVRHTGKTHAAYAALSEAAGAGIRVYGTTVRELLGTLEPSAAPSPAYRLAHDADLYLFDDFTTYLVAGGWGAEHCEAILEHRARESKRQIITYHGAPWTLADRFGPGVWQELSSDAVHLHLSVSTAAGGGPS